MASDKTRDQLDRALDMLKAYKNRQDAIVLDLSKIVKLINLGACDAAKEAANELMAQNLKQSKERVGNFLGALKTATTVLERMARTGSFDGGEITDALTRIELLSPDEFMPPETPKHLRGGVMPLAHS